MKYVIQRPRPTAYFEGYSFPSMHVLSVCILVSLILLIKRNKILYCIAIILVASIIISVFTWAPIILLILWEFISHFSYDSIT